MNRQSFLDAVQVCAGLTVAPLAWLASVQLSQILPYMDCADRSYNTAICAMGATAVALIAGAVSLRRAGGGFSDGGRLFGFIGWVAGLTAMAISFALALQILASLTLNACER
jgi:hypothetical protein